MPNEDCQTGHLQRGKILWGDLKAQIKGNDIRPVKSECWEKAVAFIFSDICPRYVERGQVTGLAWPAEFLLSSSLKLFTHRRKQSPPYVTPCSLLLLMSSLLRITDTDGDADDEDNDDDDDSCHLSGSMCPARG